MNRILLVCQDAFLRKQLAERLKDIQGVVVCTTAPADVVIGIEPLLSEAQKESLLAYAECGDIETAQASGGVHPTPQSDIWQR